MKNLYIAIILPLLGFFINLNAQTPNLLWAKQLGGSTTDRSYSIAVDAAGNVYTTGAFTGTADFNPSTDPNTGTFNLTAVGNYDVFISKLDPSGNFVWAKSFGGTFADYGYSIAIDPTGYIYTTGYFQSTVDFNPGAGVNSLTSAGTEDVFISKLDFSGNFIWAKKIGGTSEDVGNSIAVNAIGNISITGYFYTTADFDPGAGVYPLTSTGANSSDIFVSTLDASGNFLWAKKLGGSNDDEGQAIAVDPSGNVFTTGFFSGTADFDPGNGTYNFTSAGNADVFISKLDPSGNFVWAKQLAGTFNDHGYSIAVDPNGNVYTTGDFNGTTDFNPSPFGVFNLTSNSNGDAFVSKLDINGDFVWAKKLGGVFGDYGTSIKLDDSANVYTTGYFWGTADFDPGEQTFNLISAGDYDIFVSKLTSNGEFVWAARMGGASEKDVGNSIALNANGSAHITGSFYFTADFDPGNGISNLVSGNNPNNIYEDVFVVKLCQVSAPTVSGTPSFCQGSSTTLTSSSANSYLWSNGATTQSIVVAVAGNYSVTVTNSSGCSAASTITTVLSTPTPTVTVMTNNQTICAGQSATLTASGATSYLWSNGLTSNSITVNPSATTTYTVTGTTAGCTSLPVASQVIVNPIPVLTVNSTSICSGESATLTASGASGYQWSTGQTTNPIIVNPNTTTTYTVTGTTAGCTSAPVSAQVIVNPIPTVTVNNATICAGQQVTLTANGTTSYLWSTGETTNSITVNPTFTTTYNVTGTTAGCASSPVSAQVIVNPIPAVKVNSATICAGQPATLTANGATSYLWSNGATTNSINVSPNSTTTYTVTGTTAGCASLPVAAQVTVNPIPIVTVNGATICAGQTATLAANGAAIYLWSNGETTNSITVNPSTTTIYTVTGTIGNCTSSPVAAQVTVINAIATITVNNATICPGQQSTLTASGATSYLWITGETTSSITVSPTLTTTYTVTGTTAGCTSSPVSTQVTVNSIPVVTVNSATICAGQVATLTANGATSYLWSNGEITNSIAVSPTTTTTYTVTGTTTGCVSLPVSAQVTVTPNPSVTVNSSTICAGQLATLTANGATDYLWSNGETTSSITISPNTTTIYTVTGTTAGCTSSPVSAQVTVINPIPTITVNNGTICAGQQSTLTANGATSYLWSTGETTSSITVSPTLTTTYTVTGTTAGCTSPLVSTQVTVNPVPAIDLGGDIDLLEGQDTILDATGVNVTYVWSTGATTPTITVNTMGTYSVTITNSAGCSAADAVDVTIITSTSTPDNRYKISVTPNPAHDYVNITCEGSATSSVQIIDNLGRVLAEDHTFALDGATRIISLEKMPSGTYYLRIVGNGFVKTVSIVKQ